MLFWFKNGTNRVKDNRDGVIRDGDKYCSGNAIGDGMSVGDNNDGSGVNATSNGMSAVCVEAG